MVELRTLVIVLGDQLDLDAAAFDGFESARDAARMAEANEESTWADPHVEPLLPAHVVCHASPSLFPRVDRPCASFSQWWTHVTRGAKSLRELPGLATWVSQEPAGPLFTQSEQT